MRWLICAVIGLVLTGSASAQPTHTSNIDNAPAWQASHTYNTNDEVETTGGSGIAGTRGYKLKSGICTSGTGSSPTGTGSSISDGTCNWKYLCDIDYTSISSWLEYGIPSIIAAPAWQPSTAYTKYDFVETENTSPIQAYYATNSGTSCALPATGPSGSSGTSSDCGVTWQWYKTLTLPQTVGNSAVSVLQGTYIGYVYKGAEYLNDGDTITDSSWYAYGNPGIWFGYHNQPTQVPDANLTLNVHLPTVQTSRIVLTAAPGESIFDNPSTSTPLKYDASKGVAIRCTSTNSIFANSCIYMNDWNSEVDRIQISSPDNGVTVSTDGGALQDDLIDSGEDAVWMDNKSTLANSVVYAGNIGVGMKYHDTIINNTIFGKTGALMGVYAIDHPSSFGAPILSNTAIMGFTYCAAYGPLAALDPIPGFEQAAPPSDYNATDVGSGGIQNGTNITWSGGNPLNSGHQPGTSIPCPGSHTLFNVPFTTANFVNTTSGSYDARLVAGSSLLGAGGSTTPYATTITLNMSNDPWPDSAIATDINTDCTPQPYPYGDSRNPNWCTNPLMSISGTGIPTDARVIAINGLGHWFISMTEGCSGCSASEALTMSYAPVQASDIFGRTRPTTMDIGAMQYSTGGGGRMLFR